MNIYFKTVRNEKGSAIIIVLFVLAILTIIGISASNTSEVELNIAGNDKVFRMAFYSAESGTYATAKRVSYIVDTSEVPAPVAVGADGLRYGDTTNKLYDEVLGLKNLDGTNSYDATTDILFSIGGVDAVPALPGVEQPVSLSKADVAVDLKRLGQYSPAGEAAEFGTGAEGLGGKTIIVIPYALASEGKSINETKAKIRSVYYKYKDKPGGI